MQVIRALAAFAVLATGGTAARAEQTQSSDHDGFYRVNGLVEIYAYDASQAGSERFGAQSWTPRKPLEFVIDGKVLRSVPDPTDPGKPTSEVAYILRFAPILKTDYDSDLIASNEATDAAIKADSTKRLSKYVTRKENSKFFWISKSVLDSQIADGFVLKRYKKLFHAHALKLATGAALALPFKLRPATEGRYTKLETDVTVGGYVGVKTRMSDNRDLYASFVVTAGLVTLPVNSDNTGEMSGGSAGDEQKTQDTTLLGVTYSGAAIFDLEGFQIGLAVGRDRATGEEGRNWIYNNKTWFSFSIGYTFLKKD